MTGLREFESSGEDHTTRGQEQAPGREVESNTEVPLLGTKQAGAADCPVRGDQGITGGHSSHPCFLRNVGVTRGAREGRAASREAAVMSRIGFNGVRTDRAEIKLGPNRQARGRVWRGLWGPEGPGGAPPHEGPEASESG